MARRSRMQIVLTPSMELALSMLSYRSGLSPSSEARRILRSALDRTISSAEFKSRYIQKYGNAVPGDVDLMPNMDADVYADVRS